MLKNAYLFTCSIHWPSLSCRYVFEARPQTHKWALGFITYPRMQCPPLSLILSPDWERGHYYSWRHCIMSAYLLSIEGRVIPNPWYWPWQCFLAGPASVTAGAKTPVLYNGVTLGSVQPFFPWSCDSAWAKQLTMRSACVTCSLYLEALRLLLAAIETERGSTGKVREWVWRPVP